MKANITLTPAAIDRVHDFVNEARSERYLRIYVKGGGCSGFTYGFAMTDRIEEDDFQAQCDSVLVLVDSLSHGLLEGAQLDYVQEGLDSRFVLNNPKAQATCGCGQSFTV